MASEQTMMTINTSTTDNIDNSGMSGGEFDAQVSGAIEAEDAMAMEEAMTMIAAGDLNDFSDDDNAKADDEGSAPLLGATMTATTTATMELPPPLPPLPGIKPPPEAASDDEDIPIAMNYNKNKATYYAVRVGYAVCPSNSNSDSVPVVVSTIRSAIFLRWEDVKHFVEFATSSAITTTPTLHSTEEAEASSSNRKDSDGVAHSTPPFHHNVEYKVFHDIALAERYLNKGSCATTAASSSFSNSTSIRAKKKAKSSKHKLFSSMHSKMRITVPAKSFNPITKKWQNMYDLALHYKATHGNLDVPSSSKDENYTQYEDLSKWIKYQRSSYRSYLEDPMGGKHSMTEQKVNQLEAAGFTWIHSDKRAWLEEESSSMRTKKKRGRPRKTVKMAAREAAYRGHISTPKPIRAKWLAILQQLKEYKERTNSIDIPEEETDEELVALRLWVKGQKNLYCRWRQGYDVGMAQEKADMLKEVGVELPPSWEDMYDKALQYKVRHGNSIHGVSKSDDPILAAWVARQDEVLCRHLQGKGTRLSDDQAIKLLNLGVNGGRAAAAPVGGGALLLGGGGVGSGGSGKILAIGRTEASIDFDAKWNSMYVKLQAFKAEHGHCNVNTTSGSELAHWVAAQRRMYNKLVSGKPGKRASLDAVKMQRLTEIGFSFRPRGSYTSWEDNMTALWKFRQENGHCRVPVNHPTLGSFVKLVRRDYKNWTLGKPSSMTPERETALKTVGFAFEGGKTPQRNEGPIKTWEERLEELVQFKAEFGHTVVPQNSGQLGAWVHSQRVHYKKFKAGEKSQMTAEKALRLTEIGFCFNASDRFRGNKRHRSHDQAVTEGLQQPQQEQQQQNHHLQLQQHHDQQQQHYRMQELVHIPQGFQTYI